ncbi:spermidine synthase [Pseudonocardia sp. TRM90224]|uniref:spermidine synthase n=1 Tax=Pseudonocardia sp. TRM90224 TaxID=2812678 RepID=UPI001E5E8F2D|nr:fused MFS/spermidine synthase [Pseudonocardia sp. TRM90224]
MPRPERSERIARASFRAEIDNGSAELLGDPDRLRGWTLLVDGTAQSHVDLDDPTHLEFEYIRRLGHVIDLVAAPTAPLRVLHLGGGAWTLARYVAATRPGSPQRVVEIDGALAQLVADRLPADDLDVVVADARAALSRLPAGSTDLLLLDVFAGARTPSHLTTVEFLADAARVLAPGGVYAANVADGGALTFAKAQVAAVATVFAELAVVASPEILAGRRFGNLVVVGSQRELPVAALARRTAGDPFRATVLDGVETAEFAGAAVAPSDRTATPSPLPPPGFFGRPEA